MGLEKRKKPELRRALWAPLLSMVPENNQESVLLVLFADALKAL